MSKGLTVSRQFGFVKVLGAELKWFFAFRIVDVAKSSFCIALQDFDVVGGVRGVGDGDIARRARQAK